VGLPRVGLPRVGPVYAALVCAALSVGCTALDAEVRAQRLARSAGLNAEVIHTDSFELMSFGRLRDPHESIHLYIEGDGRAWASKNTPALDPTPRHALALQLAARDPASNVVYLARPCQFTAKDPHCDAAYWTGKRYAPEVVDALDEAVSQIAARAPGQPLQLIGYSGGGALAILVAARRSDVASIRTVAGNLDPEEVTRLNRVSGMPQSLNPIDEAQRVAHIAQLHFSGGDDRVVPPSIARRFATAAGGSCVRTEVVPSMGHEGDWAAIWSELLLESVDCRPK
jgi:pimeloyl-ACP methyl ester carboxylesterase